MPVVSPLPVTPSHYVWLSSCTSFQCFFMHFRLSQMNTPLVGPCLFLAGNCFAIQVLCSHSVLHWPPLQPSALIWHARLMRFLSLPLWSVLLKRCSSMTWTRERALVVSIACPPCPDTEEGVSTGWLAVVEQSSTLGSVEYGRFQRSQTVFIVKSCKDMVARFAHDGPWYRAAWNALTTQIPMMVVLILSQGSFVCQCCSSANTSCRSWFPTSMIFALEKYLPIMSGRMTSRVFRFP